MAFQLTDRNRSGAGDVPGRVLGFGPHVEQQHLAALEASGQLLAVDELYPVPIAEVGGGQLLEAGHMFGGNIAQRRPQLTHPVARQHVEDPRAVSTCDQDPGAGHRPKVVRGVGDGLADLLGDVVDRPLTLGEHIDDLGAAPAGQGLGHLGERLVQRVLGDPVTHAVHVAPVSHDCQVFKRTLDNRSDREHDRCDGLETGRLRMATMRTRSNAGLVAFVDDGLGNSSYLVDLGAGRALVVDPGRHPGGYLAEAERRRLDIAFAVETHLHADFVSGARELGALGAQVLVPGTAGHSFAVQGVADGEEVDLGGLTLRGLATPGHTPEHLSYLLLEGPTPLALFSGGSLLVDAVARTDLIAPDQTEGLARELWRSLHERILTLPEDLPVYPTHGAGSFCSAPGGAERITTIGRERAANPLLAAPDEDAFVKQLLDGLGTYPPYFLRLRDVNRAGPRLYGPASPLLPRLRAVDVARLQRGGALVVDARPVDAFARGHIPGALSIALRPQFATWLGWLAAADTLVVVVLDADQDRAELVRQARNIGYETILGELDGGITAWMAAGNEVETSATAPASQPSGYVLDVRQASEYATGHLPGAVNVELGSLDSSSAPSGAVSLMCGHGERAMTAASLLAAQGATTRRC